MEDNDNHEVVLEWDALPVEIRLTILDFIDSHDNIEKYQRAHWASVCLEWQRFFEKTTFDSLSVQSSEDMKNLHDLNRTVKGHRRNILKKLHLQVNLAEYSCEVCDQVEDVVTVQTNTEIFSQAMLEMFSILSSWDNSITNDELEFEVKAMSPSTVLHLTSEGENLHRQFMAARPRDRPFSNFGAKQRKFGTPLELSIEKLPQVSIIRRLTFGSYDESVRLFSAASIRTLLSSMHGLKHVILRTPRINDEAIKNSSRHCGAALLHALPLSVTHVALSEPWHEPQGRSSGREDLCLASFKASRHLEAFSALHGIDAESFFRVAGDSRPIFTSIDQELFWPRLKYLALTTTGLTGSHAQSDVDNLLTAAGEAALRMPMLQMLQIACFDNHGKGFIFWYFVTGGKAEIWMWSSWGAEENEAVFRVWSDAAVQHARRGITEDFDHTRWAAIASGSTAVNSYNPQISRWL